MEFLSNFIWEKHGEACSRVALVLQQAQVHRQSVFLACVCESDNPEDVGVTESGYFTEGLTEWYHRSLLKLCEKKCKEYEIERSLHREIGQLLEETGRFVKKRGLEQQLHYWGILLWENQFWIFSKGDCEGYLLNRRFQKKHLRKLEQEESGKVQRKIGILLCTRSFLHNLEAESVAEMLLLDGEVTEERIKKRLWELWQENIRCGETRSVGAIYVYI